MQAPLMAARPLPRAAVLATAAIGLLVASCAGDSRPPAPEPDPALYGQPVAGDPWGHYIRAASERFDVPEGYIRTVMQIESGGRTTLGGRPITSRAGAMGLMQVMPATFAELRRKHDLGPDPHDPWTNIQAGTAYIREMYDLYGSPGFLAAYNCGPGCYGEYLAGRRSLPGETRNYLAKGTQMIAAREPGVRVASAIEYRPREQIAAAGAAPVTTVATVSPGAPVTWSAAPAAPPSFSPLLAALPPPAAASQERGAPAARSSGPLPVALPAPVRPPVPAAIPVRAPAPVLAASATPGGWAIQVGAFSTPAASSQAAERARRLSPELQPYEVRISEVATSAGTLYRARLVGLNEQGANSACLRLSEMGAACVMLRES